MREIKYAAIPTMYAGVQYRSRLEAKWACLLDHYRIHFDYEPFELGGGKKAYIPDFIIELNGQSILLECKPAIRTSEFKGPAKRITRSGWTGPAIIGGSCLYLASDDRPDLTLYLCESVSQEGWYRGGRTCWPPHWGQYPFSEDLLGSWRSAGNVTRWVPETP